ncbi:hypothetical protein Peur_071712 [Populus x canadensis]
MHDLAQFVSELTLEWSHNFDDSRSERDELQVLDSLRPHQSLEKLSVTTDGGTVFPPWIGDPSFTKMLLRSYVLMYCKNAEPERQTGNRNETASTEQGRRLSPQFHTLVHMLMMQTEGIRITTT